MSVVVISSDFAKGFDEVRKALLGDNAKLVLLQEEGTTVPYNQLQIITSGWYPEYSSFFGNTTFHFADITGLTGNNIRNASFLMMIETFLEAMNNVVYEMKPETAPPDSNTPWWRIRASTTNKKYIPPNEV